MMISKLSPCVNLRKMMLLSSSKCRQRLKFFINYLLVHKLTTTTLMTPGYTKLPAQYICMMVFFCRWPIGEDSLLRYVRLKCWQKNFPTTHKDNSVCTKLMYSVSQKKVVPLKLFPIFSLRLSIFPWNFANLLPVNIHTCLPVLVDLT